MGGGAEGVRDGDEALGRSGAGEKIKASGAEVVCTGDWIPDAANLLKQARQMGVMLGHAAFRPHLSLKVALSLAHRVYLMGKARIGFNGTVQALKEDRTAREKHLEV